MRFVINENRLGMICPNMIGGNALSLGNQQVRRPAPSWTWEWLWRAGREQEHEEGRTTTTEAGA